MTDYNLASLLEDTTAAHPDRDAIVFGDTRLTYAQVNGAANQVANLLVSRGIEPGDKVALSCPNLPYFTIVYFGILKAGATVVPLNVLLKGREVAYHLGDSDAKAYFCFQGTPELPIGKEGYAGFERDRRLRALLRDHRRPGRATARSRAPRRWARPWRQQPPTFETVATDEDDTAVILYTSGTTGQPKGAELRHRNMRDNALAGDELFGADAGQPRHLPVRAAAVPLLRPDRHPERRLRLRRHRRDAAALRGRRRRWQLMLKDEVTFFAGVPTMYWGLLGALDDGVDVSALADNLRVAAAGGSALPGRGAQELREEVRRHASSRATGCRRPRRSPASARSASRRGSARSACRSPASR